MLGDAHSANLAKKPTFASFSGWGQAIRRDAEPSVLQVSQNRTGRRIAVSLQLQAPIMRIRRPAAKREPSCAEEAPFSRKKQHDLVQSHKSGPDGNIVRLAILLIRVLMFYGMRNAPRIDTQNTGMTNFCVRPVHRVWTRFA